jgi:hypothetical protein
MTSGFYSTRETCVSVPWVINSIIEAVVEAAVGVVQFGKLSHEVYSSSAERFEMTDCHSQQARVFLSDPTWYKTEWATRQSA